MDALLNSSNGVTSRLIRIEAASEPVSSVDEEFLMNTQEIMDMYERRAKLQGRRETVLRLFCRKFGTLPDDIVVRVQNADAPLLEQLEDKVLFAQSLDEVFAS